MKLGLISLALAAGLAAGCATEQGTHTAVGTGTGAVVGAGVGNLIGHDKKSTAIGAAVGAAVGAGVGYNWTNIRNKLSGQTAGTGTQITDQPDGSLMVNIPSNVTFDTDSATIKPSFRSVLDGVAQTISQEPRINARVVGHTDSTGNPDHNMALSQRRAQSVATYLADRGVANTRLTAEGRGQTQPVASNASEEGRTQNRRVEIYLKPAAQ
ncbi:OmpA family protein [Variovorax sp. Varisp85]|jgi:outer membrane protein OmpA-like peptidoglycan-associated protein|uniref:OmpA family protein n=1 Tax=unclassified Variovorax TaxID=663243 RepID=UPI000270E497|nr:OmpA family protein [Variovorax sp. CF313]EJL72282.1 outer membrane protein/peptidoglycan-associated lipoprotein [Variovorax sp. CF313]